MNCPDLAALKRVGTPRGDPSVVEHVRTCDSCWLDWQIQQGARALDGGTDREHGLHELDRAVMAEIALANRRFDGPAGRVQLMVSALLIAAAILTFLLAHAGRADGIPVAHAAVYAAMCGLAGAIYCRARDRRAKETTTDTV